MLAVGFRDPNAVADITIGLIAAFMGVIAFIMASRSSSQSAKANHAHVDADAYMRAQTMYESALRELREEIEVLKKEIARLRKEKE